MKIGLTMKMSLVTAFTAIVLLATSEWNVTASVDDQEAVRLPPERVGVMRAADDHATSSASMNGNRKSTIIPNEEAGALKGEDPELLRLELIACLLTMLVVSVAALLGVCYFDHQAVQQKSSTGVELTEPPKRSTSPVATG